MQRRGRVRELDARTLKWCHNPFRRRGTPQCRRAVDSVSTSLCPPVKQDSQDILLVQNVVRSPEDLKSPFEHFMVICINTMGRWENDRFFLNRR